MKSKQVLEDGALNYSYQYDLSRWQYLWQLDNVLGTADVGLYSGSVEAYLTTEGESSVLFNFSSHSRCVGGCSRRYDLRFRLILPEDTPLPDLLTADYLDDYTGGRGYLVTVEHRFNADPTSYKYTEFVVSQVPEPSRHALVLTGAVLGFVLLRGQRRKRG